MAPSQTTRLVALATVLAMLGACGGSGSGSADASKSSTGSTGSAGSGSGSGSTSGSGSSSGSGASGGTGTGGTGTSGGSGSGGTGTSGSGSGSGGTTASCGSATGNSGHLVITTTSCPGGVQGSSYTGCTIAASGGTPPYTYCVASAATNPPLPEGMALNSTTGVISAATIGGQGYYGTKFIVTDSASPNNMATAVIGFSLQGNNAFMATMFPATSIFRHRVDSLPVDTSPAAAMDAPASTAIHANFGNTYNTPWPYGMPAIVVPYNQPNVAVATTVYNSNFSSAPIPSYAPVEFWNNGNTDRHVIVYREAGGTNPAALFEMYQANYLSNGTWTDASNSAWQDLSTNVMTPLAPLYGAGTTLASGLPNAATIVNADEVIGTGTSTAPNGSVQHPIRLVLAHVLDYYVWPATTTSYHNTGTCSIGSTVLTPATRLSQSAPPTSCQTTGPFGQIYRLKANVTLPACATPNAQTGVVPSPQSAIIIRGLRQYGVILGDNSFDGGLWGTPDRRWNDADLRCLQQITLGDFEPVNVSSLMVSPTSFATH